MWTRERIESLPYWERPRVRCRVGDGPVQEAEIVPDANKVWVVLRVGGQAREETVGWELLLAILNDPREAPVYFWPKGDE